MPTFRQLPSGNRRAQVRRKGVYAGETFRRHKDAQAWALATERRIDLSEPASRSKTKDPTTFGNLMDLHVTEMKEVLRAPRRSKAFTPRCTQDKLGKLKLKDLTRERLIQFGKDRAREGAGPVTIRMDIGYIKLVVSHAAAVHGVRAPVEPTDLARIALKRLGLVGKGRERTGALPSTNCRRLPTASPAIQGISSPWGESCGWPSRLRRARTRSAASHGRTQIARHQPSSIQPEFPTGRLPAQAGDCFGI